MLYLSPFHLMPRPIAHALVLGAIGAACALALNIPLALLLGPLIITMIVGLMGGNLDIPEKTRSPIIAMLGAYMATDFTPETIDHMLTWPISLMSLPIFILISTAVVGLYLYYMTDMDRITALFASVPGGLLTMVIIGGAMGGDRQRIAIAHVLRIVIAVFIIIYSIWGFIGIQRNQMDLLADGLDADPIELLIVLLLTMSSAIGAKRFNLPAPHFLGPMVVISPFYLTGVLSTPIPGPLLGLALWIMGSAIGSQFSGFEFKTFLKLAPHIVVSIIMMLGITLLFALAVSLALSLPLLGVLLAFSPGGIAEMSMIALALEQDAAFVAIHHLIRITFCIMAIPLITKCATALTARAEAHGQTSGQLQNTKGDQTSDHIPD